MLEVMRCTELKLPVRGFDSVNEVNSMKITIMMVILLSLERCTSIDTQIAIPSELTKIKQDYLISYSSFNNTLIALSQNVFIIWNSKTGERTIFNSPSTACASDFCLLDKNELLISGWTKCSDMLSIANLETGVTSTIDSRHFSSVTSMKVHPSNDFGIIGCYEGVIIVFSIHPLKETHAIEEFPDSIRDVTFSLDADYFGALCGNKVYFYRTKDFRLIHKFKLSGNAYRIEPCGGNSFAIVLEDGSMCVIDSSNGKVIDDFRPDNDDHITDIACSENGICVLGTYNGEIIIRNYLSRNNMKMIKAYEQQVLDVVLVGDTVISTGHDATIRSWNIN